MGRWSRPSWWPQSESSPESIHCTLSLPRSPERVMSPTSVPPVDCISSPPTSRTPRATAGRPVLYGLTNSFQIHLMGLQPVISYSSSFMVSRSCRLSVDPPRPIVIYHQNSFLFLRYALHRYEYLTKPSTPQGTLYVLVKNGREGNHRAPD